MALLTIISYGLLQGCGNSIANVLDLPAFINRSIWCKYYMWWKTTSECSTLQLSSDKCHRLYELFAGCIVPVFTKTRIILGVVCCDVTRPVSSSHCVIVIKQSISLKIRTSNSSWFRQEGSNMHMALPPPPPPPSSSLLLWIQNLCYHHHYHYCCGLKFLSSAACYVSFHGDTEL